MTQGDLFAWRDMVEARAAAEPALTLADLHVVRRAKVSPHLARCIREACGLYGGEDRD